MKKPVDQIFRDTVEDQLKILKTKSPLPSTDDITKQMLHALTLAAEADNLNRPKTQKLKMPETLNPILIGDIILNLYPVCRISFTDGGSNGVLAMYCEDGDKAGLYDISDEAIERLIQKFNYLIKKREMDEVIRFLKLNAPVRERTSDPDLIAVNNGIFNYRTKQLLPFSPEYVFTSKTHVDYNPAASNMVIHNPNDGMDWDVVSWMRSLSDDPQIVALLWEIIGAVVRPNVRWGKAVLLYSPKGNNGKGTLCRLMRNLVGAGSWMSIPIADCDKDYFKAELLHMQAVITDENPVGQYIERSDTWKSMITQDAISTNRKYKDAVTFTFCGLVVQCINDLPRSRDVSGSFYRRLLTVPLEKCFTGVEREYIKDDYLGRKEVLEYVLKCALESNYYELREPEACLKLRDDYMEHCNPVLQFWNEFRDEFVWDFIPYQYLYDLYCVWFNRNNPKGMTLSRNTFTKELINVVSSKFYGWNVIDPKTQVRPCEMMSKPEPISMEYDLTNWMQKDARTSRLDSSWVPILKDKYYGGLKRRLKFA